MAAETLKNIAILSQKRQEEVNYFPRRTEKNFPREIMGKIEA